MERQKRTLKALGLRRVLYSVEVEATPQILGMVKGVYHLVKVEGDVSGSGYQVMSPNALQQMLDSTIANEKVSI